MPGRASAGWTQKRSQMRSEASTSPSRGLHLLLRLLLRRLLGPLRPQGIRAQGMNASPVPGWLPAPPAPPSKRIARKHHRARPPPSPKARLQARFGLQGGNAWGCCCVLSSFRFEVLTWLVAVWPLHSAPGARASTSRVTPQGGSASAVSTPRGNTPANEDEDSGSKHASSDKAPVMVPQSSRNTPRGSGTPGGSSGGGTGANGVYEGNGSSSKALNGYGGALHSPRTGHDTSLHRKMEKGAPLVVMSPVGGDV